MVGSFDAEHKRETVFNRWGETLGVFVLMDGYWDFIPDEYRKDQILKPTEIQWLERRQMELNT